MRLFVDVVTWNVLCFLCCAAEVSGLDCLMSDFVAAIIVTSGKMMILSVLRINYRIICFNVKDERSAESIFRNGAFSLARFAKWYCSPQPKWAIKE